MEKTKRKLNFRPGCLWTLPSAVMLLCLTIAPLVMLLIFSFMNRNLFPGQPWPGWTLNNLTRMMDSTAFWRLLGKSLLIALLVTLICIILAYPAAWAIAKVVNPQISAVDSLRGMLKDVPDDIDLDSLREERLLKYENNV